jgi:hypothetical protein
MDFGKRDIVVLVAIWVGVFALGVVVAGLIADENPATDDGAAMAPFALVVGGVLSGLYILVRERSQKSRKRLAAPQHQQVIAYKSSARFRDNWKRFALAAGVWAAGTALLVPALGIGSASVFLGGLLAVGVLLVLHRRDERQRK